MSSSAAAACTPPKATVTEGKKAPKKKRADLTPQKLSKVDERLKELKELRNNTKSVLKRMRKDVRKELWTPEMRWLDSLPLHRLFRPEFGYGGALDDILAPGGDAEVEAPEEEG